MSRVKTKKDFEKWIRTAVDKYRPILGIELHKVLIEHKNETDYLAISFTYPYLDPKISYSDKAFKVWADGKMEDDRILHELCHIITDPFYCKAISRHVSENEIRDEREHLTDTITAIIRRILNN